MSAVPDSELNILQDLLSSSHGILEHPDNVPYLAQLPSLPLSDLLAAPTALSTQSHTLTSSLTTLTHTSYPTFLSLHKSTSALLGALSSLDSSLNTLLDDALPPLDEAARVFREKSGPSVIEQRKKTRVVLEQQDKLRDLLDIPVLIDTCVRNGLYTEALTLAAHASTVLATLSTIQTEEMSTMLSSGDVPPLPLVRSLQAEVTSSLYCMRLILLNTLYEPSRKLPALWKAVQFLRKMHALSEDELAFTFASARIDCLRSALQNVERDAGVSATATLDVDNAITGVSAEYRETELGRQAEDIARFLKKYIDIWREGTHDIITQYSTMFVERSPSNPTIRQSLLPALLSLLLPPLQTYLQRAHGHLSPLATQLAYCSSAMARVGMDFRPLLSPLIAQAVVDGFNRDIRIGAEHEWDMISNKTKSALPSTWLVSMAHPLPSLGSLVIQPSAPVHAPPQMLSSFPPLAISLNTYLRALNRLRSFAPLNAMKGVTYVLESNLSKVGQGLLTYAKGYEVGDKKELDILRAGGTAFARIMVPFLRRAMAEGVFGVPYTGEDSRQNEDIGGMRDISGNKETGAIDVVLGCWESWLRDSA
ncbi:hypothetical protein ID866_8751 [Astraeus odoratus]|nr:hypothetical protein ID866_8751 [Astraeus odoratus]